MQSFCPWKKYLKLTGIAFEGATLCPAEEQLPMMMLFFQLDNSRQCKRVRAKQCFKAPKYAQSVMAFASISNCYHITNINMYLHKYDNT